MTRAEKLNLLQKYCNEMPHGKYKQFCQRVQTETDTNYQIFKNWLSGRTEIPTLAINEIVKIYNQMK